MIKILISHHFKIQVRVFPSGHVQASISVSSNLKDKIHLEPELNVMTQVLNRLFEFNLVIE